MRPRPGRRPEPTQPQTRGWSRMRCRRLSDRKRGGRSPGASSPGSPTKRVLFHTLLDGNSGQGAAIVAAMAPDAPRLNPLFLNIGLAAFGTDEHAFHIVHLPDFLHTASTVA